MPGFYVHIPFCAHRCPYCDFAIFVGAKDDLKKAYVSALRREIVFALEEHARVDGRPIETIFFGGGTPTALEAEDLVSLLMTIRDHGSVEANAEISIEANPDGLTGDKMAALHAAGWNRISFGVQSFDDEALRRIGRTHRAADIVRVFAEARAAGFTNLSLDLMFALPGQQRERWRDTLKEAVALKPEHISCYSLTIEGETPFARRVERGEMIPLDDDSQSTLMEDAVEVTRAAGLLRYEVSNYARPGYECRHNENYWRGGDYLSAGCGAHGHRNGRRWWNERDTKAYVVAMEERGSARAGEETLSPEDRLNEILMMGLRTRSGFPVEETSRHLKLDVREALKDSLPALIERGVLRETMRPGAIGETNLVLAPEALAVADAVVARLAL